MALTWETEYCELLPSPTALVGCSCPEYLTWNPHPFTLPAPWPGDASALLWAWAVQWAAQLWWIFLCFLTDLGLDLWFYSDCCTGFALVLCLCWWWCGPAVSSFSCFSLWSSLPLLLRDNLKDLTWGTIPRSVTCLFSITTTFQGITEKSTGTFLAFLTPLQEHSKCGCNEMAAWLLRDQKLSIAMSLLLIFWQSWCSC